MKKIIIVLSVLFMALSVNAQEVIWKLTYDVGIPFSATKEFTSPVSWRGLSLDFDRFVGDNLAVGLGFSWSTFVEKEPDSDYQRDNILLHGTQVRYINDIPLTARFSCTRRTRSPRTPSRRMPRACACCSRPGP